MGFVMNQNRVSLLIASEKNRSSNWLHFLQRLVTSSGRYPIIRRQRAVRTL